MNIDENKFDILKKKYKKAHLIDLIWNHLLRD
jgi:hypothetical protein